KTHIYHLVKLSKAESSTTNFLFFTVIIFLIFILLSFHKLSMSHNLDVQSLILNTYYSQFPWRFLILTYAYNLLPLPRCLCLDTFLFCNCSCQGCLFRFSIRNRVTAVLRVLGFARAGSGTRRDAALHKLHGKKPGRH